MRGSFKDSFHGNRGGSIKGRKGSMRGSFRVPKQAPGGGGQMRSGATGGIKGMKPKVETKMVSTIA